MPVMLNLNLPVAVTDIICAAADVPQDELFDLIVELDKSQQEWDFTERLYHHFRGLHKELKAERKKEKYEEALRNCADKVKEVVDESFEED